MFEFKKKPISSEWVQKAFKEKDKKQAITNFVLSKTDADQDSSRVNIGKVKIHATFSWRLTRGQNN